MDDPYGLPADFRNFTATSTRGDHGLHLTSSSSPNTLPFPDPFSVQRNLTSSFPLGGVGLVELGSDHHYHHHHHHHGHGHNIVHHDHDHQHHFTSGSTSCALYGSNISNIHHHHHHHDQTMESSGGVWNNSSIGNIIDSNYNEANNTRWPRQETLTLLEIRSRLNSKFKETNQKAPLWDEVSRIMAEEHGYHRSGKKCKEKFENLYKYYKKTKEGKAGRQDGKHYRFFRQLEAIYGDQASNQSSAMLLETNNLGINHLLHDHHLTSTGTPNLNMRTCTNINNESLSFSINSAEFETSSSENNNEDDLSAIALKMKFKHQSMIMDRDQKINRPSRKSSSWKSKVEDFVDEQMKKIMVTQETWMEKMLKSIIDKEEERLAKEEEWRKQEAAKFNQEVSEFWAKEKAWVEARDAALMGALKKFRGKGIELPSFPERVIENDRIRTDASCANYHRWSEEEISSLIELQTEYNLVETFQGGISEYVKDGIWEEIASKMACLGYKRTSLECKEKWESVSVYVRMTSECGKKRKEDYYKSSTTYFDDHDQLNLKQEHHDHTGLQLMDEGLSPSSSTVGTQMHPNSCFHLLFGEGENLWEKYGGLKLSKADKLNQQVHNK